MILNQLVSGGGEFTECLPVFIRPEVLQRLDDPPRLAAFGPVDLQSRNMFHTATDPMEIDPAALAKQMPIAVVLIFGQKRMIYALEAMHHLGAEY